MFYQKGARRNFEKFTGKQLCQSLFLNKIKMQTSGLQIHLKRDAGTDVFLKIFRNFQGHLFLMNASGGCFWSGINAKKLRKLYKMRRKTKKYVERYPKLWKVLKQLEQTENVFFPMVVDDSEDNLHGINCLRRMQWSSEVVLFLRIYIFGMTHKIRRTIKPIWLMT